MDVGVRRPVGGKARGAPHLPPVEVPVEPLKHPVGLVEAQAGPVVPALLVGLEEEAEVVDLESG